MPLSDADVARERLQQSRILVLKTQASSGTPAILQAHSCRRWRPLAAVCNIKVLVRLHLLSRRNPPHSWCSMAKYRRVARQRADRGGRQAPARSPAARNPSAYARVSSSIASKYKRYGYRISDIHAINSHLISSAIPFQLDLVGFPNGTDYLLLLRKELTVGALRHFSHRASRTSVFEERIEHPEKLNDGFRST
jgi:hypothetical protein